MESALRYHSRVDLSNKNSTHAQLIILTGRNKKVLEVGPATGYITEALRARGCRVTCIERDAEAAKVAAQFCERIIVGDIEKLDLESEFGDERFDAVMFGDVLEHLVDPQAVLVRTARVLASGGYVVASVPNIAHGSIRISLLRGRFSYTDIGLLDRTHLRFFTRDTLAQMFAGAGYDITTAKRILIDPLGTELELREDDVPSLLIESLRKDREAMTYQFVVKAHVAPAGSNGRSRLTAASPDLANTAVADLWRVADELKRTQEAFVLRDQAATQAAAEAAGLKRALRVRQGELEGALRRIADIENSAGWRALNRVRPVIRRLAPRGSLRFRLLRATAKTALALATARPLRWLARRVASPARRLRRPAGAGAGPALPRVNRLRVGCYGEHCWTVGGGTVHALQLLVPLTPYFDVDLLLPPGVPLRDRRWYRDNLLLDIGEIKVRHYSPGVEDTYDVWLSVWNERIWPAKTAKRFNMVFFPFVSLDGAGYTHITNGEYSARYIKESYQTDDVIIVRPCVNVDEYGTGPKEPLILHVSRFSLPSAYADKAHIMMIQAFKQLCDRGLNGWKLVLAGATLDQGEATYAGHLAKHSHGYPVEFALNLPAAELRALYGRASLYWHATGFSVKQPAAQEHFGITIIEGMASGAVPVVYNSGGPPEIITSGENGYLFDTLDELIEDTWTLATDPQHWRRLSKAARERARFFSPESVKALMLSAVSKTDKVSIIMGTHSNLPVLRRALDSIFEHTPPGYELIVVDNGSTDGTGLYLASLDYPHLKVVRNRDNQSFAAFNNQGQRHATREYILYLNDDVEVFPGWIEPLIEVLDSSPGVGAVGSRLLYPDGRVQHDGKMFKKSDLTPYHINMGGRPVPDESPIEVDALTAACLMLRRDLAGYSTDYKRGYYEDTDLCMRIKEKGFALVLHRGSVIIHYHGLSMGRDQTATEEAQKRNREIFLERWGKKLPDLVYLASDSEMAGKEIRCRPVFSPGQLGEPWPISRRLHR
jgi:GT2 family glycosyltransferase/glycosyltransferase involved in cell wall biosynthesis/2-polyprenyl-3-methyl-5-hydroxy-6-metoxy-1,4-benzoquinol methylase